MTNKSPNFDNSQEAGCHSRLVRPLPASGVADCPACHGKQTVARHNSGWTCHKCGYLEIVDEDKEMERCEWADHPADEHQPAKFPVNPERDAKGNAVLYPGMVRYEGVAAIFGTPDTDQFVILAPTWEGLKRALAEHNITDSLDAGLCRIATLESLPNVTVQPPAGDTPENSTPQ